MSPIDRIVRVWGGNGELGPTKSDTQTFGTCIVSHRAQIIGQKDRVGCSRDESPCGSHCFVDDAKEGG